MSGCWTARRPFGAGIARLEAEVWESLEIRIDEGDGDCCGNDERAG
jgi:hypothetical protein